MVRSIMTALVLAWAAHTAAAQTSALSPRDGAGASRAGNGVIKGRVVDGHTGSPLPRARVTVQGAGDPLPVLTDDAGGFAVTALPGGLYWLTVDKASYLPGRYPEPGRTLRKARRPFAVFDGQVLEGVTVPLYHGGAISGRVVDAHGEPVEFANVQAVKTTRSRAAILSVQGGVATNDLGEFRIARLDAGSYLLLVQPRRNLRDDGTATQSVPTFYPGVSTREQAVPIAIERGTSVTGVELMLVDETMGRVIGTLVDASGQPARGGFVNVRAIIGGRPDAFDTASAAVKPDGTFELRLAPGEYQMEGRAARPGVVGPLQEGDEQIGMTRVTVTSESRSEVAILVGGGAMVTGRILFDGPVPPAAATASDALRVSFTSPDGSGCRGGRSDVGASWTFSVTGVLGTCVAQVNTGIAGLTVKAVMANDVDLLDRPATFESGQLLRNVEVILTVRQTDLAFHVVDDRGEPTAEYVALVFPVDPARWTGNSRYIRSFVPPTPPPDQEAEVSRSPGPGESAAASPSTVRGPREAITGLPQGTYYVIAVDDLESEGLADASVLETLSRSATRIRLTDNAPAEVDLRRINSAGANR